MPLKQEARYILMGEMLKESNKTFNKNFPNFDKEKYEVSTGMVTSEITSIKHLGNFLNECSLIDALKIKNVFPKSWKLYLKIGKLFLLSEQAGD